jgi:hypothetical protein
MRDAHFYLFYKKHNGIPTCFTFAYVFAIVRVEITLDFYFWIVVSGYAGRRQRPLLRQRSLTPLKAA